MSNPRTNDGLLTAYLRSVSRIPKLEPEDLERSFRELKRSQGRDLPKDEGTMNRVVLHHLGLVIQCARQFGFSSVPMLDLIQEGNLGLMRAAESFDVDRGVCFSTYACWWIRRNILRAVEGQGRTVRVPAEPWGVTRRIRRAERERGLRSSEPLDREELAGMLDVSPEKIDAARGAVAGELSCDSVAPDGGVSLGERLSDVSSACPDGATALRWTRRALARALDKMDARTRQVLVLRWGLDGSPPLTQPEVGRRFGITGPTVCRIEKQALANLRRCRVLRALAGVSGSPAGDEGALVASGGFSGA